MRSKTFHICLLSGLAHSTLESLQHFQNIHDFSFLCMNTISLHWRLNNCKCNAEITRPKNLIGCWTKNSIDDKSILVDALGAYGLVHRLILVAPSRLRSHIAQYSVLKTLTMSHYSVTSSQCIACADFTQSKCGRFLVLFTNNCAFWTERQRN